MVKEAGLLIVVSAPSGAGKTSLCEEVIRRVGNLVHSVSYTTRAPRPHEEDGRDYHFITPESFQTMVDQGEFAEWARVHGHLYGTSRRQLEEHFAEGRSVILDLDTQGAAQLRQAYPGGVFVFIMPPTLGQLEARLRTRQTDAPEEITRRMRQARKEIESFHEYDYVVVNNDFEKAVTALCAIIAAERCRSFRLDPGARRELGL